MLKINLQPIEKLVKSDGLFLDVHSVFATIQGEGPFAGRPAVFVRLAGCNLQCPSCDTEYTKGRQEIAVDQLLIDITETLEKSGAVYNKRWLVVITGGEPFRQNIAPLCRLLMKNTYDVQIETNGTLPVPITLPQAVVIVCSPKNSSVQQTVVARANCFKYVISHDSISPIDGLPILALNNKAEPQIFRIGKEAFPRTIYLQPMDAQDDHTNALNLKAAMDSCLKFGYTLQLQLHKIIKVA
jgi:organic radical activating enzyme